jgi:hypothetical protein
LTVEILDSKLNVSKPEKTLFRGSKIRTYINMID